MFLLKLSWPFSKVSSIRHSQPRDRIRIIRIRAHIVTPPIQCGTSIRQRKEDQDRRNRSAGVHCSLEKIIVPLPPLERSLPDVVVEDETKYEPQRILRCVGWGNVTRRVEEDGHVDVAQPTVRIAAVEHIYCNGGHRSDQEEEHQGRVDLAALEHSLRANGAPDERGVVVHLGSLAGKSLSVVRRAQIRDVAHHPTEDAGLHCSGEDGGVDLADKEDPGRNLHILAKFEVLCKVHAVLDSVVAKTLDHHVGNGLSRPGVTGNELGDDVQEAVK